MSTTTTARTDKYGFPIRDCTRCGGSGRYSYNQMHGDMCYGCSGKGVQHTPKAQKAYDAYVAETRTARRPMASRLVVGDEVRRYDAPNGSPFATIASIVDTGEVCGWSLQDGDMRPSSTRLVITLDDGTEWPIMGNQLVRRKAKVDVAPYLAQAG